MFDESAPPRKAAIVSDYDKGERIEFLFAEINRGVPRDPCYGAGSLDEVDYTIDRQHSRKSQKPRL
jgi:hypothetical protein